MFLEAQGGTYTGTYTYGDSLIRRNGEFFMYDGLGSVRTYTNASGIVTAAATYDGYGNTVATSGSTGSPYQFGATSGYRCDGDAGIMQVGARYYDPATGSFLTRDTDLSQLAYVYCEDNAANEVDPTGNDGENVNNGPMTPLGPFLPPPHPPVIKYSLPGPPEINITLPGEIHITYPLKRSYEFKKLKMTIGWIISPIVSINGSITSGGQWQFGIAYHRAL